MSISMSYMRLLAEASEKLSQLPKTACGVYPETFEKGFTRTVQQISGIAGKKSSETFL